MNCNLKKTSLADVSEKIDYGFTASATDKNTGTKFLRITDIQNGFVKWKDVPFCEIDSSSKSKYLLSNGDIVVARTGNSTGENFLFQGESFTVFASYLIRFRVNKKIVDPSYVWRCMRSSSWWNFVEGSKTGSAQAGANAKVLGRFEFEYPPLPEQKAISQILRTLDEKIELNQKNNECLEEIAKALFKSWLIDFDPVRAKSERHSTGLPNEISDLFPDSFVNSEIGEIPNNWEIKSLDEIATYLNGLALQKYPSKGDSSDLPVIKIAQLRKGNSNESDKCSGDIEEKYIIKDGDILFSWSGSLLVDVWTGGVGALNQHLFKVTSDIYKKWYTLHWTKYHLQEFQRIAKSKATTMGHIQRHHLSEAKVTLPPKYLMKEMNAIFDPLLEREIKARLESKFLFQLRDTILPKLISGELRIQDAEKMLDKVGI